MCSSWCASCCEKTAHRYRSRVLPARCDQGSPEARAAAGFSPTEHHGSPPDNAPHSGIWKIDRFPGAAVGPARVRAAKNSRNVARRAAAGRRNQHRHSMRRRAGDELGPAERGGQLLVYCLRPRLQDREPTSPRGTRRDCQRIATKAPRWSCRSDNSCRHTVHSEAVLEGLRGNPVANQAKDRPWIHPESDRHDCSGHWFLFLGWRRGCR